MAAERVGDRYELIARVGKGGMASVYRAQDTRLLRDVAVKVLGALDPESEGLFYFHREARAIAAMRHQNIVQIYDYSGANELPAYIVMELIEGGNIDEMLMRRHPLPSDVVIAAAYSVASALAHAHEHGVIHRDIKPANVMVENSGRLLLTDFGIAKAYKDEGQLGNTVTGKKTQLFGTPDFMAPEQILDEPLGPHTDVFSLGSLVYCLATNASPFDHKDTVEILRRVADVQYTPVRERRPDFDDAVEKLVAMCLKPDADERPTAARVAERCEQMLFDARVSNAQKTIHKFLKGIDRTASGPVRGPPAVMEETITEPDSVPGQRDRAGTDPDAAMQKTHSRYRSTDVVDRESKGGTQITDVGGATQITAVGAPGESMNASPDAETFLGTLDKPSESTEIAAAPTSRPTTLKTNARPRTAARLIVIVAAVLVAMSAAVGAGIIVTQPAAQTHIIEIAQGLTGTEPASDPTSAAEPGDGAAPETPDGAQGAKGATPGTTPAPSAETTPTKGAAPEAAATDSAAPGPAADGTSPGAPTPSDSATPSANPKSASSDPAPLDSRAPTESARSKTKGKKRRPAKATAARGPGNLSIRVRPWGTVFVDGEKRGNTPMVGIIKLPAGKHTIEIKHPSLGSQKKVYFVRSGKTEVANFDLRK